MASFALRPHSVLPGAIVVLRRWAGEFGPPVLLFGAVCLLQLGLIAVLRDAGSPPLGRLLLGWDGRLYLAVAEHGYPAGLPHDAPGLAGPGSRLALFPVFPAAVRAAHLLTGLDFADAALLVSRLAAGVAAVLVHRLFGRLHDRRTGLFMVALTAAQPMAVVLGMGGSEAVFLACAAGALLAAYRGCWAAAGVCGVLAGLTRCAGLAVGAALVLAAVLALRGERRWRWRPVAAALAGCAATPGYLLWVGRRTGSPDGWFRIQRSGWGAALDWGAQTWDFVGDRLSGGTGWVELSIALLVLAAVGGCLLALPARPWPPLALYGLLVTAIALGQSGSYSCKPRLLVPALIFLLPAAVALGRVRPWVAWPLTGAVVLAGGWYGAYLLTGWPAAV
ncbi:hypothetical protein ACIGXM_03920 [Kitasatospora sp. NPDC052896]|uniref:hypothetical protein n=1 Tax=Kitasatospora sp. NPDC052896 TaxID=3364061 RepID=UPI0037C56D1D